MKIKLEVPLECVFADRDERFELAELMWDWGCSVEDYTVQHVSGHGIVPDRCYVYAEPESAEPQEPA